MAGHEQEVDEGFLQGMRNRMYVSFHKYGPVRDAYPQKADALKTLGAAIEKYRATGNTEYLIDAANYAMIEFMCPSHPEAHFEGTDSDQSIGRYEKGGDTLVQFPNRDLLPG